MPWLLVQSAPKSLSNRFTKAAVYSVLNDRTCKKSTEDQEKPIDALLFRYSQCVAVIQDQIFRGVGPLKNGEFSDLSRRDKTNFMEKRGEIVFASVFRASAALRNKFVHQYNEENPQS